MMAMRRSLYGAIRRQLDAGQWSPHHPPSREISLRSFHSSERLPQDKKKNAPRDTRLAGRQRFYKSVGITPVAAPWQQGESSTASDTSVESPISAGVDGTQSASGVGRNLPSSDRLQSLLAPRKPGLVSSSSMENAWFGVTLDGRNIRTPLGQILAVPSRILAMAIAAEWDAQVSTLKPAQMPLMTLACTTIDQTAANPQTLKENILRYLSTDTTCYWADPKEDRVLHRKQEKAWKSLHDYTKYYFSSPPAFAVGTSEGLLMSRTRIAGQKSSGLPHPQELVTAAEEWVDTLDAWHLTALHSVTAEAKSFLIGMAVMALSGEPDCKKNPFGNDLSKAVLAARVEEEFSIENWGLVEGQHDYDRLNASIQMHSAHILTSAIASENFVDES